MKNKFNIGDVVEVSATGAIIGIELDNIGKPKYTLLLKNNDKQVSSYLIVPESAIVHHVPTGIEDMIYEQERDERYAI